MNHNYEQQYKISLFVTIVRDFLLKQDFFEHHLYSTLDYKIENTDTFNLKESLYLRYNPEPDIWQVGIKHDKFFWIGSMFRNEQKIDPLHQCEFTVVDIYQAQGTMKDVLKKYIEILKTLEKELKLQNLSDLEIKYITHKEFSETNQIKLTGKYWFIVTDYPIKESFYDTQGIGTETSKFEIFLVNEGKCVEIAACGGLGENLNGNNYVKDKKDLINKNLIEKKFVGFGIGLERLISLYEDMR
jgi:hypothetical protein